MNWLTTSVDFTKVETIVYHLPDGADLQIDVQGIREFFDFEFNYGHICDNSQIDGCLHFFPKGNA